MIRAQSTSFSYMMRHEDVADTENKNAFYISVHRTAGQPVCRFNVATSRHDMSLPLTHEELYEMYELVKYALTDWDRDQNVEATGDAPV